MSKSEYSYSKELRFGCFKVGILLLSDFPYPFQRAFPLETNVSNYINVFIRKRFLIVMKQDTWICNAQPKASKRSANGRQSSSILQSLFRLFCKTCTHLSLPVLHTLTYFCIYICWRVYIYIYAYACTYLSVSACSWKGLTIREGSLEVKLPTIWTDEKAEVGRVREEKRRSKMIREEKESEERRCRCAKR
jgi:hypothetical protein